MKRIICIMIMVYGVLALGAQARHLAVFDLAQIAKSEGLSLREAAHSLAVKGLEIYHYTDAHLIAGIPEAKRQLFSDQATILSPLPAAGNLYLISRLDRAPISLSRHIGELLLDMEDVVLLRSELDEVQLREAILYPFCRLELVPMRFAPKQPTIDGSNLYRDDILQMLGLVSDTSVLAMIQSLQDFQTRYALAPNRLEIAEWVRDKYLSFGMADVQLFPFAWNGTTQYNVVATIAGNTYPDQYIVVGGHHDSINQHGDPYLSAPGADDNASGAVATLEMARVMIQSGFVPRCSIRFMTFAAEEFGLWGSKAYAQHAEATELDIRLMINHDMIANNSVSAPNWRVMLMPYDGSLEHSAYTSQITQTYTSLGAFFGNLNSPSSDSYPFWQKGYNVVYFFEEEFSPHYHSSNDVVANIDPVYAAEVIKASAATAAIFASMPSAPSVINVCDGGDGHSLIVQWQAVNDGQVTGYRLCYGTQLNNMGNPIEVTGTSYTITGLTQGQPYYVALSSVDMFGNASYPIYAMGVPLMIPQTPAGLTEIPDLGSVTLSWNPNQEWDMDAYRIYRSQEAGELGNLLATIPHPQISYTDSDVYGGQHYYYYSVVAVDKDGNASQPSLQIRSRPISLDQGVLLVDETKNLNGVNPFQPTDAQVDDFYAAAMQGFEIHQLDLEDLYEPLRLCDIGIYSSILWHGNDLAEMDYPYFIRDVLNEYIIRGGNILFSVYQPSLAFDLNSDYPHIFANVTFIHEALGIAEIDLANQARFRRALPNATGYPAIEVDPQKTIVSFNLHITRVEGMGAADNATVIYRYASDYEPGTPQGYLYNTAVGIYKQHGLGKAITLSFPLFNMHQNQAQELCYHVFNNVFGEANPDDDTHAPQLSSLILESPCPNPFKNTVNLKVKHSIPSQPISIKIYNQRGQLVRTLHQGPAAENISLTWDGKDDAGRKASCGIYLVKASQRGKSAIRKLVLIR